MLYISTSPGKYAHLQTTCTGIRVQVDLKGGPVIRTFNECISAREAQILRVTYRG